LTRHVEFGWPHSSHRWSIATHQRDLTPEQIEEAMATAYPNG
jgi:hypothetical protein